MSVYNIKDIIRINQEIGESGELRERSSLEFALYIVKQKKSWLFELSYFLKSLIIDHPFIDGNKRTAFVLCRLYFDDNKAKYNSDNLKNRILNIAKKNITNINKIQKEILKC